MPTTDTKSDLNPNISKASDPLLLVDDSGGIRWRNDAASKLLALSDKPTLGDFLDTGRVRDICRVISFGVVPVAIKTVTGEILSQSALVLDLGLGGIDEPLLLIVLKSVSRDHLEVQRQNDFLATVAHDIKNPIGAVFGYADTLLDTPAGDGMSVRQKDILQRIRDTAGRAIDLVRNYQHLTEISSGRGIEKGAKCDLNAVVSGVVDSTLRDGNSAPVALALSPGVLSVAAERTHIDRIASNLLTNALKFTPPTGRIYIETVKKDHKVYLSVSNTGAYIPKEETSKIFDRYSRGTNAAEVPGSGLGLYIVKRISEAVGGSVSVESSLETGTTFTVSFPEVR